jgi:hypothetical protein
MDVFVLDKDRNADASGKTIEFTSHDRMFWLANRPIRALYRADKKHKRGWTATAIIRDLCRRYGVPVGVITPSTHLFTRREIKGNFLAQVRKLLADDKKATGRKFDYIVSMEDGLLNVRKSTATPPRVAFVVNEADMVETGNLRETALAPGSMKTQVRLTGKIKTTRKNKHHKVVSVIKTHTIVLNPIDPMFQAMYGVLPLKRNIKGIHTKSQMLHMAKSLLASSLQPSRDFTVTARAIPFLRVGDRVYVSSPYFGIHGLVSITSVAYELRGNDFTMTMSFNLRNQIALTSAQIVALEKKLAHRGEERVRY